MSSQLCRMGDIWLPSVAEISIEVFALFLIWIGPLHWTTVAFYRYAKRQPWFKDAAERRGLFCRQGIDEVPIVFSVAVHHTVAGGLIMASIFTGNSNWFVHACLMELTQDTVDTIRNLLGRYPYNQGRVAFPVRVSFVAHHVPTIILIVPFLSHGMHANPYMQRLGANLLFGGGLLLWTRCGSWLYDRDKDARYFFYYGLICWSALFLLRWVHFPYLLYLFVNDLNSSPHHTLYESALIVYACAGFLVCFNAIQLIGGIAEMREIYIKCFEDPSAPYLVPTMTFPQTNVFFGDALDSCSQCSAEEKKNT